jgi:non-heme chloroperoxidase
MIRTGAVPTEDGLRIAYDDAGPPGAPAVIFLHGIGQSRTAFRGVLEGPLARDVRAIAFDLRGHGASDKPGGAEPYAEGALGRDLAALIDRLDLRRPVLVPWSYGGVVAGEFLRHHAGAARVGGVLLAAASVRVGRTWRALFGPTMTGHGRGLMSDDEAAYRATSAAFVAGCTATARPDFAAAAVEAMALVPSTVRRALLTRDADYLPDYAAAGVPVAAIHGDDDQVVLPALSEEAVARIPGATLTRLPGVGHAPFVEAPEAFERALRALLLRT